MPSFTNELLDRLDIKLGDSPKFGRATTLSDIISRIPELQRKQAILEEFEDAELIR